eukprot:m.260180 g.260180  ORF g.260180 m.260180 type:complete len:1305 (+) comp40432_c0_seq2:224-4138(+)
MSKPLRSRFLPGLILVFLHQINAAKRPSFQSMPHDVVCVQGNSCSLDCAASGDIPLIVTWYKDDILVNVAGDARLVIGSSGRLEIKTFQRSDEGRYSCLVSNGVGAVRSRVASAKTAELAAFSTSSTSVKSIGSTGYSELTCNPPTSVPDAVLHWKKGSSLVDLSYSYMMKSNGNLIVSQVNFASGGMYTCHATNDVLDQEVTSPTKLLSVAGKASVSFSFLEGPADAEVIENNVATFRCIAVDARVPAIVWFKDDARLVSSGRVKLTENYRKLQIDGVKVSDGGVYKCKSGGQDMTATLTVLVPPAIVKGPVDTQALIGDTVRLPCNVSGSLAPVISWYKDGNPIPSAGSLLTISASREADSGVYQCRVHSKAGEAYASASVSVSGAKPVFVDVLSSVTSAFSTLSVTLPCSATGAPRPTFSWQFQGVPVQESADMKILQSGSLVISKVGSKHKGKYTCAATNQKGTINQSTILDIYNPTVFVSSSSSVYRRRGLDAVLSCHVTSHSQLSVSFVWTKDGSALVLSGSLVLSASSDELTVKAIDQSDQGKYNCTATTSKNGKVLDTKTRSIGLIVQDVPGPPTNVMASHPSSSNCSLTWIPPTFSGNSLNALSYYIEYNSSVVPDTFMRMPGSATISSAIVSQLHSYIVYQFRVRAVNEIGVGKPSDLSSVLQTLESIPTKYPVNLRALPSPASPDNALLVLWDPAPSPGVNGPVVRYRLRYKMNADDAKDWEPDILLGDNDLNATLDNLQVHAVFALSVCVENNKGLGAWSPVYLAQTGESAPSGAPVFGDVSFITSKSVTIRFVRVPSRQHNGILRGYKVYYRVVSSVASNPPLEIWTVPFPNATQTTVTGLLPNTQYSFEMRAFNNAGVGPKSQSKKATTLEATPGPVVNLTFVNDIENGLAHVFWSLPIDPNGKISGHIVEYRLINGSGGGRERRFVIVGDVSTAILKDLQSGSVYEVTVKAETRVGPGKPVTKNLPFGPELPGPPVTLVAEWRGGSVILSWETPKTVGLSNVGRYKIEYQSGEGQDWKLYEEVSDSLSVSLPDTIDGIPVSNVSFRVAASNSKGYGSPALFSIPDSSSSKPFYREIWFFGLAGGVLLVLVVILFAVLCCKRKKRRRYVVKSADEQKGSLRHGSSSSSSGSSHDTKKEIFELSEVEERFPSARATVSRENVNQYRSSPDAAVIMTAPETISSHNTESGESMGGYYSAAVAMAKSERESRQSRRLIHLHPPPVGHHPMHPARHLAVPSGGAGIRRLYTPSSVGLESAVSSDVDKPELSESEFSYQTIEPVRSHDGGSSTFV